MSRPPLPELPDNVVDQAIGWLVRIESDGANPQLLEACQRWRQAHHTTKTIGAHHTGFLIGKVFAWEECRWRQILIENQYIRCKDAGLFVHFTGERQGQLTNVCRHAIGRYGASDTRDIQGLATGRKLSRLRFRLIDWGPYKLLQRRRRNSRSRRCILWNKIHICERDGRNAGQ